MKMPHLRAESHIDLRAGSELPQFTNCRNFWSLGAIVLVFCCFALLPFSSAMGREVRMQEVTISLHNKAVSGFQVRLDRSVNVVAEQVAEHVAKNHPESPFQYDNTIIYENILYRPISVSRKLSLYFMLRNVQDQLTELTMVVMYDYHRSISTHDFPSLALLVQADLARLVRLTTGDIMRSDRLVFDDPTLNDLAPLLDMEEDGPMVEHFKEEEVENQGVLIHSDPFEKENVKVQPKANAKEAVATAGGNPELERLKTRVRELELREKQLLDETDRLRGDQVVLKMKQERLMDKLAESKFLQDSVKILNRRIADMLGQYYVSDDFSVSNETAAEMQDMEKRLRVSEERIDILDLEIDSLQSRNNELRELLATTGTGARSRAKEIRNLKSENKTLAKRNERLREDLQAVRTRSGFSSSSVDSLLEVLGKQKAAASSLQSEISALERSEKRLQEDFTRASSRNIGLEERIEDLEAQNRNLSNEVAALRTEASLPAETPSELRDSLRLMAQRLDILETAASKSGNQADAYKKQSAELAQKKQEVSGLRSELKKTQGDLASARKRSGDLESDLASVRSEKSNLQKQLQKALDKQALDSREKNRLEALQVSLMDDLRQAEAREVRLEDSLQDLSQVRRQLRQQVAFRDRQLRSSNAASDSLSTLLASSRKSRATLSNEIQALELRIDSLEAAMPPSDDQGNFIREQWAKLQTWEKELNARSTKVGDREKLVDQRSRFLAEREEEVEAKEERLEDLEERETRLKALEERLKASEPALAGGDAGRFSVREGKVTEFGEQVPVFIAESKLSIQQAQRRAAAYFLSRGEFSDEQFPDLIYKTVQFPEFDEEPLEIQIRVDSRPGGSILQVSFKYSEGRYIGPNSSKQILETARQLVGRMTRFNF